MFLPDRERALFQHGSVRIFLHSLSESIYALFDGIQAYRAKRDWDSPVPLITTSQSVSERDSMLAQGLL